MMRKARLKLREFFSRMFDRDQMTIGIRASVANGVPPHAASNLKIDTKK